MKVTTVRELRNHYRVVLDWVEGGQEVAISSRGKIIARLIPERPKSGRIDWTQSAAMQLDRKSMPVLTRRQVQALLSESAGKF